MRATLQFSLLATAPHSLSWGPRRVEDMVLR
jgi:hypothetical protein